MSLSLVRKGHFCDVAHVFVAELTRKYAGPVLTHLEISSRMSRRRDQVVHKILPLRQESPSKQDATVLAIFQRINWGALRAKPEMLYAVRIRARVGNAFLALESKEPALAIAQMG